MSVLRDRVIEEHINKNYPNSKLLNYDDPESDLIFYSSEELQNIEEDWFPLCCYKDINTGKAMYGGRKRVFHTYTEGETGAGKTTRFVMQSILALSSLKIKPSFVIVDIHGEIIENLYNHLKQNGYSIKILNCDNPHRSDTYNPFAELSKECLETKSINNDAINKIRKISEIIQPVESSNDPIWDRGARSYTNGCILDKFEDLIRGDIPKECLTIYNVIQNHYWLREALTNNYGTNALFRIPHYKKKGSKALSTQKMISVTDNADKTRASYFGVIENHYDTFGQPSLYSLSSNNTIDISDFINNPSVIVIQSGNTKIGDDLISLLVNDIYTHVIKIGKENQHKRLPRNIHCFLDEFANCNIADGPEYIKMLTTSRKFGMFWHMILQSDAQLDRKFDPNIGRIIRANSTELFMGSHDYETEVRFAKSCGQKTIESLSSVIGQQDPHLEVVDLITTERLNLTEEGYVYIKSNRHSLMKSYIEAFYNCDEFVPVKDVNDVYPYNKFDYQQTSFYLDDIPPSINTIEYEFLNYINTKKVSMEDLTTHFYMYDVKRFVTGLIGKKLLELSDDVEVRTTITKRQMELYKYKAEHGFIENSFDGFDKMSHVSEKNNPFDFDIKSTPKNDKKNDSASAWDDEETWKWWDDSSDSVVSIKENPLYVNLKNHIEQIWNENIESMLGKVRKLTIIPEFLLATIDDIIVLGKSTRQNDISFPDNTNFFKFEIIETFIKNNDYDKKELWCSKMREEFEQLEREKLFPPSIIVPFRDALNEVEKELTLSNILEIKKIISGDS